MLSVRPSSFLETFQISAAVGTSSTYSFDLFQFLDSYQCGALALSMTEFLTSMALSYCRTWPLCFDSYPAKIIWLWVHKFSCPPVFSLAGRLPWPLEFFLRVLSRYSFTKESSVSCLLLCLPPWVLLSFLLPIHTREHNENTELQIGRWLRLLFVVQPVLSTSTILVHFNNNYILTGITHSSSINWMQKYMSELQNKKIKYY